MDFGEEVEALPVLSTTLTGKRKRDLRKEDTDERRAKKVTFGPSTMCMSKSNPATAAPKKQSTEQGCEQGSYEEGSREFG